MKGDWSVSEQEKHLTEAEKQIRRLESLRSQKEETSKASAEKAYFPPKTQAEKMTARLQAMRDQAQGPKKTTRRPKIEGKQKSSKLTFTQLKVLEELLSGDKRLRGSAVTRIALNRFLGLDNTAEENDLEAKIIELLRQFKNR